MRKKQYLTLVIILIIIVAALIAVILGKKAQTKKAEAEEEASIVYVNAFETGDVTTFSYQLDGETVSFELQDEQWVYTGDTTMEIDAEEVESFLTTMSEMDADSVIEDAEDTDQYGLDEPSQIFTVEFSDGSAQTYEFGIENEMVGGYYLQTTDSAEDGTVYLISSSIVTSTLSTEPESFQVEEEDEGSVSE
ncbi:MAG: DUF4340 domain-containing protein [Lachnospiraceae bacterium]|nr:DUF4340 domain-containing protein [Lachnospiraceae bacterium]